MTAPRITAEEVAAYRTEYSTAIYAGHTVSHVNRILDALESACAELNRLREIELSDDVRGMLSAKGSDGEILVVGEFSSGREFVEKFRPTGAKSLSAQGGEVPELTEEPVVVEDFADNGAHSQWRLVIPSTNTTLWEEATARPAPPHPDTVEVSREEWDTKCAELASAIRLLWMVEDRFSSASYEEHRQIQGEVEMWLELHDPEQIHFATLRSSAQAQPATERR